MIDFTRTPSAAVLEVGGEILVVLVPATVGTLMWRAKRDDVRWTPFLGGIVATGVGLSVAIATYFWVFSDGGCEGSEAFTCRLNGNQGVLAGLGIVLAVVALWTTVLTREFDRRRAAAAGERRFSEALDSAIGEVRHNLIHVAVNTHADGSVDAVPHVSALRVEELLSLEFRQYLHQVVLNSLDAIRRNVDRVNKLPQGPTPDTPESLQALTQTSLLFFWRVLQHQPKYPRWVDGDPVLNYIRAALDTSMICPYFASRAEDEGLLPGLRTNDIPVLCWWKDRDLPGVTVLEQGQRFFDYQAASGHLPPTV